ncbi:hypothetical protein [Bradyrhizobium sp. 33ap4]|uniref:hypothetical protein n=1 Tax=Bradyrhizobium sp. 33ap4 TaxID=3061630 RepID=UPI0029312B63|nr:hypothetical protein [Bradyrhizobium sp. 33ap4]
MIGNPESDVTIIEWFDYEGRVPAVTLALRRWSERWLHPPGAEELAVHRRELQSCGADGGGCEISGVYEAAHDAMISSNMPLTERRIRKLLSRAGLDMDPISIIIEMPSMIIIVYHPVEIPVKSGA